MSHAGGPVLSRRHTLASATAAVVAAGAGGPAVAQRVPTFVFANPSEYDTLDPHVTFDNSRVATRLNFYDGLYRWMDNPPVLSPWLAERHEISADGLTYTFHLRAGAKFHDGSPVTAEDVVYSIERIIALKKGASALFTPIIAAGSTTAPDARTVRFTLSRRSATFLSTVPEIHVVNSRVVRGNERNGDWGEGWLTSNVAGSGSFRLERFDPATGVVALRNADHFLGWSHPHVERLELRTVREQTTQVLGLIRGDYHGLDGYLPTDALDRLRRAAEVQILEQDSMRLFIFHLNNQRAPLNDVHVRRAISYAFDYRAFNSDILRDTVARNPAPLPRNLWGFPADVQGYEYDLDKARAELAKASARIDRPLSIHTLVGLSQTEQAATLLQAGLRRLGIESRIVAETWPTLSGKARQNETTPDIWTNWISTLYADPHNWVGEMYDSANWGTWKSGSWYKNAEVDRLLHAAFASTDQEERRRAYEQACRIVVDEAASIFIYNTKWFGPFSRRVRGVRFSPVGNGQDFRWVSLA